MMLAVNLGSRRLERRAQLRGVRGTIREGRPGATCGGATASRSPTASDCGASATRWTGLGRSGRRPPSEYGHLANETAKAIGPLSQNPEMVVCGSSNDAMPTYPDWERQVLEECYEHVHHISLHKYFGNSSHNTLNYFGKIEETGRYIQAIGGVIDFVKAKKRAKNDVYICFDEWNVWYHNRVKDSPALAGVGTGRRRRRCSRRTTTSRTRCSWAGC